MTTIKSNGFLFVCAFSSLFFLGLAKDTYAQQTQVLSKHTVFDVALSKYENAVSDSALYENARQLYLLYRYENLETAISFLKVSLKSAMELNDPVRIIYSHSELGAAYGELGDFEQSFEQYTRALKVSDSLQVNSESTHTNYHLGKTYLNIMLPHIAEPLLEEAVHKYESLRPKWAALHTLANLYLVKGDSVKASTTIDQLQSMLDEDGDTLSYGHLFDQALLAELYYKTAEYDKAEAFLTRYEGLIKETELRLFCGLALLVSSQLEYNRGRYLTAVEHAREALAYFEKQKNYNYILETLKYLATYQEAIGDIESAYSSLNRYQELYDALISRRYVAIASTLQDHADATVTAQQQLSETEDLLKQRQYFVIALLFMLGGVLFLLYMVYQSIQQKKDAAARLDTLNQEKDHFIGVVSHDLRSPLNSIMVLSGLMKEDCGSLSKDEIEEYSKIIQNSSKRMEHLVNNMLDANKIETGNAGLRLKEMAVKDCLESVYHSTLILGKEKEITTTIHFDNDLPKIIAEPNALSRIFENLLSNAYKFSPQGSTVCIKVTKEGDQVQIAVTDQGPGLTENDRSKLFTKFEKLSAIPTANEKTTGLGLFIVKNLVKEMNGTILVESLQGSGTTFKVLFNKA